MLHDNVQLSCAPASAKRTHTGHTTQGSSSARPPMKRIFITSFNRLKKALTYDAICDKVHPPHPTLVHGWLWLWL